MIFVFLGFLAGILSGLFGIGGGTIIVPALIELYGMSVHKATGTSLAALLLPVGLFGALEYHRQGNVDAPAALFIACGLVVGIWFGARLGLSISPKYLQRAFAVFLVLLAGQLWWSATETPAAAESASRYIK